MKSILAFTFFLCFVFCLKAQERDSNSNFLVGFDVTGALGLKTNSGIRIQYEKKHLQLRSQLQYSFSEGSTVNDTFTFSSKTQIFTPTIGTAWITSHDKFSF